MAKRGTAKREAVRSEGASSATRSPTGRASVPLITLRALCSAVALLWLIGSGTAVAHAAPEPNPTRSPGSVSPGDPDDVTPTITSPNAGSVVTSASTTVSGSKTAGTGVQIENGDGDVLCVIASSASTAFSCSVVLGAGASISIAAIASLADGSSAGSGPSITVTSVPPPAILSGSSPAGNGLVRGTGIPGAAVTVAASSAETCSSTADTSGAWACLLTGTAADGVYTVSASQVAPYAPRSRSDASPTIRFVLDRTVPLPPTLSSPASGSVLPGTNTRFAGTGEDGATVTVFAGSASVCQAIVSDGAWSCTAARLPDGTLHIVAIQRDAANNTSSGSGTIELSIGASTPAPTAPGPSSPSPDEGPADTTAPTETPAAPTPAPPSPGDSPGPAAPEAAPWDGDTWDAATPFTTPRLPLFSTGSAEGWLRTVLLAAFALVGIAMATRALSATAAGSAREGAAGRTAALTSSSGQRFIVTGRNRSDVPHGRRAIPSASSVSTVIAALVGVAGLLILSKPVDGTPAYARLLFASVTATFVVALVSVSVPAIASRLLGSGRLHTTVDPRGFVIIAAAAAVSRILGLEPPLLFALVLTASTSMAVRRATEGRVAVTRILALAALGGLSWTLGTVLPADAPIRFASGLLTETLNLVTAAALGSAALMMLPFGASAGRSLWAASRPAWFAIGFVVLTMELVLLGSGSPTVMATVTAIGSTLAVGCIALSGSVWIWRRYVTPILEDDEETAS